MPFPDSVYLAYDNGDRIRRKLDRFYVSRCTTFVSDDIAPLTDRKYIRADLVDALRAELENVKAELAAANDPANWYARCVSCGQPTDRSECCAGHIEATSSLTNYPIPNRKEASDAIA